MEIGKMNRRVNILECIVVRDEYGGEEKSWIVKKSVWANIKPVSGTEVFKAQQVEAQNVTSIIIRYRTDISVLNRIEYKNKLYEIIGVSDEETDHKKLILNCKEIITYGV